MGSGSKSKKQKNTNASADAATHQGTAGNDPLSGVAVMDKPPVVPPKVTTSMQPPSLTSAAVMVGGMGPISGGGMGDALAGIKAQIEANLAANKTPADNTQDNNAQTMIHIKVKPFNGYLGVTVAGHPDKAMYPDGSIEQNFNPNDAGTVAAGQYAMKLKEDFQLLGYAVQVDVDSALAHDVKNTLDKAFNPPKIVGRVKVMIVDGKIQLVTEEV